MADTLTTELGAANQIVYYRAARAEAFDRIPLFRLAWDTALSAFGSRQVLYERFFFGDPVRMAGALVSGHNEQIAWGVPETEGHDDFVISLALCARAAERTPPPVISTLIRAPRDDGDGRW